MLCVDTVGGAVSFLLLAFPCGVSAAAAILYRRRRAAWLRSVLLIALGLLCGGMRLALASMDRGNEAFIGREDTVVGTVVESAADENGRQRIMRVEQSHIALPKGTLLLFYADTELPVHSGDRVTVAVSNLRSPGNRERGEGISLAASGRILSVRSGDGWRSRVLGEVRAACERLYAPYGQEGVAQALLIRERSALKASTSAAYRNAGLSHLLAISGLHLTVFADLFRRLLARMRLSRGISAAILAAALLTYCGITAWTPSIVRAAVMLGVLAAGEALTYRIDRLTILFAALLFLLVVSPYALLSLSLQLSFLACLGLLLLRVHIARLRYRIRRRRYPKRSNRFYALSATVVSSVLTSGSVLLFTFLLTVFSFGTVAYLAPLVNLPVLPLFVPLLLLLLLSVVAAFVLPPLAPLLAFLPGQTLRLLEAALAFLKDAGVGSVDASPAGMVLPAFFAVCAVFSALLAKNRAFRLYLSFFAAFAVSLAAGLVLG